MIVPDVRRSPRLAAALVVGATWAIGAVLPIGGYLGGPPTVVDVLSIWWYSAMLASLAAVAWLLVHLAPGARMVTAFGWLLATAAVCGAVGNALEDAVHLSGAEYLYGLGLLGSLIALVAISLALLAQRRLAPAALVAGTLAGIVASAGHGPPLMAILWLGLALSALVRGLAADGNVRSSSP